ncbi:sigma-70 family RNA polymerase sigma factor [Uliginosibacterium sp. H3]|uniref:Sigma-70 family RNA polymerase sigma factor n=1 Tax=Uliginosibacterium silvisoli TaxID=3114758 RepID=A0ABU6K5A6_9RHOO|nr:sigma-70 family RNA polymerase sigma factor [Uliginosibacterium sp. H3]
MQRSIPAVTGLTGTSMRQSPLPATPVPDPQATCYDQAHAATMAVAADPQYDMHSQQDIVAEIPRLRRYARALTGDTSRAEDLVQDTLERALSRWILWRPGNLRAWLFTIMHNIFVNQLRGAAPLDYRPDELVPELPVRAEQEDGLGLRDLDKALQQLSVDQRETLLLVTLEELSYDEAAKVLDVPVGTIMSRLFRARERLRLSLQGQAGLTHLKVVK